MLTFTLDTNCIIAVDEERSEASSVRILAAAHRNGHASVGVVAISASERQKDDVDLESFTTFKERLSRLGLGEMHLLEPMMYWGVTFWDFGLWSDDEMEALKRQIHEILFPNVEFLWADYCAAHGVDAESERPNKKWLNAKCDVQAIWSHAFRKRDIFVTSDRNFYVEKKNTRLLSLIGGRIELPAAAALLLNDNALNSPIYTSRKAI